MMGAKELQQMLLNISTYKELVDLVQQICVRQKKINSRQMIFYALLLCFLLGILYSVVAVFTQEDYNSSVMANGMLVGSIGIVAFLAYAINTATIQTKKMSEQIVLRALELKYGFTVESDLPARFKIMPEVNRPCHKREQGAVTKGEYQGKLHVLEYYFCQMGYITEESRGNRTTTTAVMQRSFLFIKFPWVKGISLRNDGNERNDYPVSSKSAEKEFNGKFILTGVSEMDCARFAKPMTVLHMLKFTKILLRPNFVFTEDGWLCIGFNNDEVYASQVRASLKNPTEFNRMIRGGIQMPLMTKLMKLVHELAEQHDDNFDMKAL